MIRNKTMFSASDFEVKLNFVLRKYKGIFHSYILTHSIFNLEIFSLEVSFALCRIFHRGSLQRCNDLLDAQYFAVY